MNRYREDAVPTVILLLAGVALVFGLLLLLGGCAPTPPDPVYITTPLPAPPDDCVSPSTPEPKLNAKQDATDLDAVKDRIALKQAYRAERNLRRSCGDQLKVLLADTK